MRAPRLLAILALVLGGCGDPAAPEPKAPAADDRPRAVPSGEDDLAAIGYVDYTFDEEDEAALEAGGVLGETELVDAVPGEVSDAFRLVTCIPQGRALLVDAKGVTRKEWSEATTAHWKRATLAPNGDLLVVGVDYPEGEQTPEELVDAIRERYDDVGRDDAFVRRWLARFDWDGKLLWRKRVAAHDDVQVLPDGRLLVIVAEKRVVARKTIEDEYLTVFDADGEVLESTSFYDALDEARQERRIVIRSNHRHGTDIIHANSAKWLGDWNGRTDCVLVTSRNLDLAGIVPLGTDELIWVWGQQDLIGPHEATWTPRGNVLVFDNGDKARPYSRVVEYGVHDGRIVWEYLADPPEDFYSYARGTSEPLANGNVLIADTARGEVFEVTRDKRVVWRFRVRDDQGRRVAVRVRHFAGDWLDGLVASTAGH